MNHNETLATALRRGQNISLADIVLERGDHGATRIRGQSLLDLPGWPE